MAPDIHLHGHLPFPKSLPQFQRLFPDDAACATYLERIRWERGFVCPQCHTAGEPFRFANRPGVLRCRSCRRDIALTADTVMERTHTPLNVWFWAAYLVASHTAGMSAAQFQRQLGLKRYETAFQILHKLRAGMVRPDADRIGNPGGKDHVEVDETWVGGATRGEGRGVHKQALVAAAIEVRQREPKEGSNAKTRRGGRYAGRLRLQVVPNRGGKTLGSFVEDMVLPGSMVITDGWNGYSKLAERGYEHLAATEDGDAKVAEEYLPIVHLVFSNLKSWLRGCHHGVSDKHLQAYLNEFTFRFNRRFYPFNAFRSLLGIGGETESPTYRELYDGDWKHPTVSGHG
jgi:transposase-like protein